MESIHYSAVAEFFDGFVTGTSLPKLAHRAMPCQLCTKSGSFLIHT
jgi:hypothetical protein